MFVELNEIEVRVLGALVEKALTTPEYYPLTLNALVNACNQKSNREPVVNYDARAVNDTLESLKSKGLARTIMGGDSRVPKYRHYFDEAFALVPAEVAVLDVLMLRGPQTVGELRGRTERMHPFTELSDVEIVLEGLMERKDGPLVAKLPRLAGRKDSRYAHLLCGEPVLMEEVEFVPSETPPRTDRVLLLEEEVARLREEMVALRAEFAEFKQQFE
jgi:uncharacterized protein YceH (UPF0502 family)